MLNIIEAVIGFAGMCIGIASVIVWIKSLAEWNGEKNCDGDCESCPFPPCKQRKDDNE